MYTATLTSLAILKVNIDQGRDYFEYFRPFVLQVLFDSQPGKASDEHIAKLIRDEFGLIVPTRTVQIVLRRLAKSGTLTRQYGVYVYDGIDDPGMHPIRSDAFQQISATINGLIEYALRTAKLTLDKDEATTAICAFLSHFDVSCLRAFLRNTAIPDVSGEHDPHTTIVSKYVMHIKKDDVDKFRQFMVVVQGHMLANALLCPDLAEPETYHGVTFYLDTPLLIHFLGLEGPAKKDATEELVRLLLELKGRVATFSHLRDELVGVLRGAAENLDDFRYGRGGIVVEARRSGTTKSDLLLLADDVEERLSRLGIEVKPTPRYAAQFQIDERAFESVLGDEVLYGNDRARISDVNSVRSIYAIRRGTSARSIERCKAILVTSNPAFAKAAWHYGRDEEFARDVSSVITDFSLANVAWLKAPMRPSSLPVAEVMAYCYAAVQPSTKLIDKVLTEIDRLCESGRITERQHRLLRSSPSTYSELVDMTLGDDAALTQEHVLETLNRITEEILDEHSAKLSAEERAHGATRVKLDATDSVLRRVKDELYSRCMRRAKLVTGGVLGLAALLVSIGGFSQSTAIGYWLSYVIEADFLEVTANFHLVGSVLSLVCGCSLLTLFRRVYPLFFRWFSDRESLLDSTDVQHRLERSDAPEGDLSGVGRDKEK